MPKVKITLATILLSILLVVQGHAQPVTVKENISTIGKLKYQQAIRNSSLDAAILTAIRFCQPRVTNRRKLKRSLKASGYLPIYYSDISNDGYTMWAHPTGAPMIITQPIHGSGFACGGFVSNPNPPLEKVQDLLQKHTGARFTKTNNFEALFGNHQTWVRSPSDGLIYAFHNAQNRGSIIIAAP